MIQPLFAFQDYSSLYLVNNFIDGFTLEEVLLYHTFTADEAKYIVMGLINIIERSHQQKFAITELCPNNIIFDRKTGDMKVHFILFSFFNWLILCQLIRITLRV